MSENLVTQQVHGAVLTITINRPRRNAINDDVTVALAAPGQALNGVLGVAVADDAVSWGFGLRWV
ncbi:hypothetical protein EB74_18170 [Mycobacterium sp. SWH-M5]|nr:hypothetical protein EB74_18170 [Mycobacterium sp. SWH-M5]